MQPLEIGAVANPNKNNDLKESRSHNITIEFPESSEEAIKVYGDTVCHSKIRQQVVVDIQGIIRRNLEKGKTPEQIDAYFKNVNYDNPEAEVKPWAPGISPLKKTKVEKLTDELDEMSDEEYADFLRKAAARRKAKKAEASA